MFPEPPRLLEVATVGAARSSGSSLLKRMICLPLGVRNGVPCERRNGTRTSSHWPPLLRFPDFRELAHKSGTTVAISSSRVSRSRVLFSGFLAQALRTDLLPNSALLLVHRSVRGNIQTRSIGTPTSSNSTANVCRYVQAGVRSLYLG